MREVSERLFRRLERNFIISMTRDLSFMRLIGGAVLAGISISIGCVVYLRVGGVAGAVLFSFGLLACVHFKLPLYTGTAGFIMNSADAKRLGCILLGNIAGCLAMGAAMNGCLEDIAASAGAITVKRGALAWWQVIVLSAMCGYMMTTAVKFGREKLFLPLLFAVPAFILCGFIHSIADAFYICASPMVEITPRVLINYAMAVIGNLIGCNLYRLLNLRLNYD